MSPNSTFSLRPVTAASRSPHSSSPDSISPRSSKHSPSQAPSSASHPPRSVRRPLSASSLRDVDLSQTPDNSSRRYPPPPTGHQLMAMFPPAPPDIFPEMRQGPNAGFSTSEFFRRQERAFFAQSGKEVIRFSFDMDVRAMDVDMEGAGRGKKRPREGSLSHPSIPRPYPNPHANGIPPSHAPPPPPPHHPIDQPSPSPNGPPVPYHHPNRPMPPPRSNLPPMPADVSPPTHPLSQHPSNNHLPPTVSSHPTSRRSPDQPAQRGSMVPPGPIKPEHQMEEYDDEAWRRPMPYNERRRAGKHTRRVVKAG